MRALAVFDLGKTNAKVILFAEDGRMLAQACTRPRAVLVDGLLTADVDTLAAWLDETLRDMARQAEITGLMISTHGCAFALVKDGRLAAPILDYEQEVPPELARKIDPLAPPFSETFSPPLPAGQNCARHMLMREALEPGIVASADLILTYPQFWSWRLSGVAASEVSFIACHSNLWSPRNADFSSLVDRMGWRGKFPPFRRAGTVLGETALGSTRLPVHNGVHDSNAALYFYVKLGFERFTLISTGTWTIVFNPDCPLDALDPAHDMLANVSVDGLPVATARFMGGREYDLITRGEDAPVTAESLQSVIDRDMFALPGFAPGGPFMGRTGRFVGPEPTTPEDRAAVATLLLAAVTDWMLTRLRARFDLILDGGHAGNSALLGLLAALRPGQRLHVNAGADGAAAGAAALAFEAQGRHGVFTPDLALVPPLELEGLDEYMTRWRAEAGPP